MLSGAGTLTFVAAWSARSERARAARRDRGGATPRASATSRLVMLPYLSGERTPHNDPAASGVLFGLDGATSARRVGPRGARGRRVRARRRARRARGAAAADRRAVGDRRRLALALLGPHHRRGARPSARLPSRRRGRPGARRCAARPHRDGCGERRRCVRAPPVDAVLEPDADPAALAPARRVPPALRRPRGDVSARRRSSHRCLIRPTTTSSWAPAVPAA